MARRRRAESTSRRETVRRHLGRMITCPVWRTVHPPSGTPYDEPVPLRIATDVRWIDVDEGAVLFEPSKGQFFDLDVLGAALWSLLIAAGFDLDQVVQWIVEESALTPDEARQRVLDFTERLVALGVLLPHELKEQGSDALTDPADTPPSGCS